MAKLASLIAITTFICFTWGLGSSQAHAEVAGSKHAPLPAKPAPRPPFSPDSAPAGSLVLWSEEDAEAWLAPRVSNQVRLQVTGLIARGHVEQVFENPSDEVVEAVYVFPLPDTAAVDGLTMQVAERQIVGEIRERATAVKLFEQAAAEGKKASLLEQERPNLFTARVANIGPGETVAVTLTYQDEVRYDSGRFSLTFPSTLTPRYLPGAELESGARAAPGAALQVTEAEAERINPPFALGFGPDLDVAVQLDAGFALSRVASPSHAVDVTAPTGAAGTVRVTLADRELADRDFRLEWEPEPASAPRLALFEEEFAGQRYAMLMLLPAAPALDPTGRIPRESVFVIDTSGSMDGTSIEQARSALGMALARLKPEDHFNVIEFNSSARRLFPAAVPATRGNVRRASDWVGRLVADGGTEMQDALELALEGGAAKEQLRQVVFITDGSVGNEADLLQYIHAQLGRKRLFTVGIGSAPNHYFMRSAARFGRGTFVHIAAAAEVTTRMNELWSKLDAPVMTDLSLEWAGGEGTETWPSRLPDLYRGEPLVVLAKLGPKTHAVDITGQRKALGFSKRIDLARAALATPGTARDLGIHRLWARRKIEGLMDGLIEGASEEQIRPQVTRLSLEHQLLSKYTSLVAVDRARSVESPGHPVPIANALPAGNAMFGNLPQTATPGPTCLLSSLLSFAAAWFLYKPRARSLPALRSTSRARGAATNAGSAT